MAEAQATLLGAAAPDAGRTLGVTRGDADAFFGLFLNNLVDILLITNLCLFVLGFSEELVFERILPGIAIGVLVGNVWFCREAWRLWRADPSQRPCALPYGINLIPILLFTFYVMLPAQQLALLAGASPAAANEIAWLSGVAGCLVSGAAELAGAAFIPWLRRHIPVAAMLTALGAAGLLFIGADSFFRSYQSPLVGLPLLFLMIYLYAGRVRLRFGLSSGAVLLGLGLALCYGLQALGVPGPLDRIPDVAVRLGLHVPVFALPDALPYLTDMARYADVLVPIGIFSALASMVTIEAARAAGDHYSVRGGLVTNGVGSLLAGCFGSPYATTVYVGHVAWKSVGAGHAYSLFSGVGIALLCLTGSFALVTAWIPMEAGMVILIWVGVSVCAQAIGTIPARYAPAVALGIIPGVAAFSANLIKQSLAGAGIGTEAAPLTTGLFARMAEANTWTDGIFALEKGWILTSLVVTAAAAACIDGQLRKAVIWIGVGALCALVGVSHHFEVLATDVSARLGPARDWVIGYVLAAAALLLVHTLLRDGRMAPTVASASEPTPEDAVERP